MRGDFTRDTRGRARRLSTRSLLLQQGRQLIDADWNDQAAITAERAEKLARDAIGPQGAPREDAGFAVGASGNELTIGAGSLYVEGLHCEAAASFTYSGQFADPAAPTGLTDIVDPGQESLVYLEAGTRPANDTDDPFLAEPGLGGADTTVHEKLWWAVRIAPLAGIGMSRDELVEAIDQAKPVEIAPFARTTGGLDADVETEAELEGDNLCELPPEAGYLDQVNRLFHIEVHDSGPVGTATFKWSEDGGVEAGLRAESGGFVIDLPPERAGQHFAHGAVVEVINPERQKAGLAGPMGTISSQHMELLTIAGVPASELGPGVRIRKWSAMPKTILGPDTWEILRRGVQVRFAPGNYVRGASWTVPGRTVTGDILWPPYKHADLTANVAGEGEVGFYAPGDGNRRYAALALVRRTSSGFQLQEDLRQVFPPLTDLTADAVRYTNDSSDLAATDVQGALDELAARRGEHCTYHARPGPGWEEVFDRIPDGAHATVCLPVGNFPLGARRDISGLGHLRIMGAGKGTRIWCKRSVSALRITNCRSVEICDIAVTAERRTGWKPRASSRTEGAIDIASCGPVRIERSVLSVIGTKWRQAACLRVDCRTATIGGAGDVTVEDCDIVGGDLSTGILVLNAVNARIENNRIRPRTEDEKQTQKRWADDPQTSASMGRLLFSHAGYGKESEISVTRADTILFPRRSIGFDNEDLSINFVGNRAVSSTIYGEFAKIYTDRAARLRTSRAIRLDISNAMAALWANKGDIELEDVKFTGFRTAHATLRDCIGPILEAGIVVAGTSAEQVIVAGNRIIGALTGVRAAISNAARARLSTRSVRIEGNLVRLPIAPLDRPRLGIYLGNVMRGWIVDNDVALEHVDAESTRITRARNARLNHIHSEGIHFHGSVETMLQVRGNAVGYCRHGIALTTVGSTGSRLRLVEGNVVQGAAEPYKGVSGTVKKSNNVPEI